MIFSDKFIIGPNGYKYIFYTINILGGISVLSTYAHGLISHVELREHLWGGITESIRPFYTINMLLATAGYFFFTSYVINKMFRIKNDQFNKIDFVIINILYAGIIIPSALWMPMTFQILTDSSDLLWIGIRIILLIVGLSSSGLILFFFFSRIRTNDWHYFAGVMGLIPFWIQTMILDALVWPYYFML